MNVTEKKTIWGRYNPALNERLKALIDTKWSDHPQSPVIEPFLKNVIADPTVITPSLSPDGQWHLITCGTYGTLAQWTSPDGLAWERYAFHEWDGFSPFVYPMDGRYYLFYQMNNFPERCWIVMRHSDDLKNWSEPKTLLEPDLPWEDMEFRPTCRNACLTPMPDGRFALYYSGGVKRIPDLGFEEPANIGVAYADKIDGPYVKHTEPLIAPDEDDPYRNIGAGAMKVYYLEAYGLYVGFNNGVYWDKEVEHSRSAIHVLLSEDGLDWFDTPNNPIIAPEPDSWKSSLVYQLCLAAHGDEWRLYYNSREGWEVGIERIGLAVAPRNGVDPQGVVS